MSKHDTWVKLKAGHPLESIEDLFPLGYPMRDPWGMAKSKNLTALYVMDVDRLNDDQIKAIAMIIANDFGIDLQQVINNPKDYFYIEDDLIESIVVGHEGYCRAQELADFLDANPEPNPEAYKAFNEQQYRDWIDGDRVPEPMPENYEDADPRFKSAELEEACKQREINRLLAQGNYSVFDVLNGTAMVDVLNQIDQEHTYELANLDEFLEE